jgi:hypothetical protein
MSKVIIFHLVYFKLAWVNFKWLCPLLESNISSSRQSSSWLVNMWKNYQNNIFTAGICWPMNSYVSSLLGETYCFHPVCLCVTKVCLYSSYNLNGNSLNLCFLAYYHMENHISIQNFDGTIFLLEDIALFEL